MARGRFLSKSIAHSDQLAAVSIEAAFLFVCCIPHLDVEGRMTGKPALVKATAFPLREDMSVSLITDLLRSLSAEGLVRWYEAGGKQVLEFPGFHNHQRIDRSREAASQFAPYSEPEAVDLAFPSLRRAV